MRFIFTIIYFFLFSQNLFSSNLFDTDEYELKFISDNINLIKEKKIEEIKIISFKRTISQILTDQDIEKLDLNNINFINSFILNFKINNEKIVNNNYYSRIKINFNEDLIFDYLIKNKLQFINKKPEKFLIIILEKKELKTHLLSNDNNYYKFLINSDNDYFKKYLLIPNLDFNDRFLFNIYHFENEKFYHNQLLNKKYKTDYQILVHSNKIDNLIINDVFLFYNNKKYFITKIPTNNMNYEKLFDKILKLSLNKWKQLNQIDTSKIQTLNCRILTNNIYELGYVRKLLSSNRLIHNLTLKLIKLNENLYEISFFGTKNILEESLKKNRLNLKTYNNNCIIKLT